MDNKVLVRSDGKMVHLISHCNTYSWVTLCGCAPRKQDENYSEHDQHNAKWPVTCKRCLAALARLRGDDTALPAIRKNICYDKMGEAWEENEYPGKPGESQDVYYEVKLKDGTYETITDVESAQEAAVECGLLFGTAIDEIECIHRIRLEEVIFPTVTIEFNE